MSGSCSVTRTMHVIGFPGWMNDQLILHSKKMKTYECCRENDFSIVLKVAELTIDNLVNSERYHFIPTGMSWVLICWVYRLIVIALLLKCLSEKIKKRLKVEKKHSKIYSGGKAIKFTMINIMKSHTLSVR
ncbi:hypothetical protein BDF20DRAFT_836863 [Mycotypha africana]|uniref:uncharacterized protein n=1 Tax=Mycotypha africana TaxID=64632 RepID=UPI0022FFCC20|nr:uncharacterized protein BDF20DRAFT_836863 [Mycotypha africana]KAI8975466.1 hypothetical protein BDF20DRAFT_836863 [Mycotypha africana]